MLSKKSYDSLISFGSNIGDWEFPFFGFRVALEKAHEVAARFSLGTDYRIIDQMYSIGGDSGLATLLCHYPNAREWQKFA